MVRKILGALAALALFVAGSPASGSTILAQDAFQATDLDLNERLAGPNFELAVHEVFIADSPDLAGFTEVRASISLRNLDAIPVPYSQFAFIEQPSYPDLFVVDAAGDRHPVDRLTPLRGVLPLNHLHVIHPGMTARWTVGFQVPSVSDSPLMLEAYTPDGFLLGSWDLDDTADFEPWEEPAELVTVSFGEPLAWDEGIVATPTEIGTLLCGDPDIEAAVQIVALAFFVANTNNDYADWPGHRFPSIPAVAEWADGSSAQFALETTAEDEDRLWRHSAEWGKVPPGLTMERAFIFAVPRDDRTGQVGDLPSGFWLDPPAGDPVWLHLEGAQPTIGVPPQFCDLGFLGGPIPYSFSPGPKFDVGGEGPFVPNSARDAAARERITATLAAAGLYFDAEGELEGLDADELARYALDLVLIDRPAETPPDPDDAEVGEVYVDVYEVVPESTGDETDGTENTPDEDGELRFYAITLSGSGTWLCASTAGYEVPLRASASSADSAAALCAPDLFGTDGDGDGTGDGSDGSGDGTGDGTNGDGTNGDGT